MSVMQFCRTANIQAITLILYLKHLDTVRFFLSFFFTPRHFSFPFRFSLICYSFSLCFSYIYHYRMHRQFIHHTDGMCGD